MFAELKMDHSTKQVSAKINNNNVRIAFIFANLTMETNAYIKKIKTMGTWFWYIYDWNM